jgi:hypothetical protein
MRRVLSSLDPTANIPGKVASKSKRDDKYKLLQSRRCCSQFGLVRKGYCSLPSGWYPLAQRATGCGAAVGGGAECVGGRRVCG